ncbi:MBL fold metallo-hydrolase [Salegentibacter salegens]|uniref:L-ascorbate metabolism protein UlaG, beta-lactamase superfamily n=1 Tax=Salegentibacter salegens TaxID=143223 RepID=A0A1M7KEW2_9FLAO|nr:MBL fold metallo-hydrolase [Salegentibacter salegens]PRX49624.1 L-ascorbate metabolism protein UlaG (beta-lactamase superfamily) [Salegentibacter salegens]SHM63810.1 L-ascorbate metabolism protein UlaG, beta-lactamase superfamily [Salegentibacter salegens]
MKYLFTLLAVGILFTGCKDEGKNNQSENQINKNPYGEEKNVLEADSASIDIQPISHATAAVNWSDVTFYIDPVGGAEAFKGIEKPDFILITDIHGDHMSIETLEALSLKGTHIIVPQAVKDEMPEEMNDKVRVLENGATTRVLEFYIEAIPMYNLPEDPESHHPKGRGNGYVVERNGQRLYIAGDTENIPEMKELENIEIALIPMNLPYTMTVEDAADGVLAFAPKKVIPYHFRGQDGFAEVEKFKNLVNEGNKDIEVEILEWYPEREEE